MDILWEIRLILPSSVKPGIVTEADGMAPKACSNENPVLSKLLP